MIRLVSESRRRFAVQSHERARQTFTEPEILVQLHTGTGELVDTITEHYVRLARNTSNVEVTTALSLSDFYYPHSDTQIRFELMRGVNPASITTYEELVESFENNTPIDCEIVADGETRSFQIKRYPHPHLAHTNPSFLQWLEYDVFRAYGDMSGIILVVLLQPTGEYEESQLNLAELAASTATMRELISFDEVALTYNDSGEHFVLHKLFPEHRRLLIPLELSLRRLRGDA